jgi:anti-anti-sigma regulatory factor
VLHPRGDLGIDTVDSILNQWLTIIDREHPLAVTVDLADVQALDRCGLSMLHLLHVCLDHRGVTCHVQGPSGHQDIPVPQPNQTPDPGWPTDADEPDD